MEKSEFNTIIEKINKSPFDLDTFNSAYFMYTLSTSPTNEKIEAIIVCLLMLEGVYEVLNPIDRNNGITNSIENNWYSLTNPKKKEYNETLNEFNSDKSKLDNFMNPNFTGMFNEKIDEKFIYVKYFASTGSNFGVTLLDRVYALQKEIKGKIILESLEGALGLYKKEGLTQMTNDFPELKVTKLFTPDKGLFWFIKYLNK